MIEHIQNYYISERNGSAMATTAGVIFLIISFLLWRFSDAGSISKGIAYSLLGAGLFFTVAGIAVLIHNRNKITEVRSIKAPADTSLQQSEIKRMNKVINSSYIIPLIIFSALLIIGLLLILLTRQEVWKGVAIGLLITGTLGHSTEAFSMKNNNAYLTKIKEINFNKK